MTSDSDRDETDPDRLTVLTFSLADNRYCVRVDAIASVVGITDTSPLEDAADPWNAGTVSVEEKRVRVVDLPRVFTPANRTTSRVDEPALLVLRQTVDDGTHYGWLVDDVDVTTTVHASDVEPVRTSARLVHGRLEVGDDDVVFLDENAIHE